MVVPLRVRGIALCAGGVAATVAAALVTAVTVPAGTAFAGVGPRTAQDAARRGDRPTSVSSAAGIPVGGLWRDDLRRVVVMARPGRRAEAERLAVAAGARVTRRLDVIHGFAAEVPVARVSRLASSSSAVVSVTADRPLQLTSDRRSQLTSDRRSQPTGVARPVDTGAMSAVAELTGARAAWTAGITGRGVDVAVIDTGVTPVPGLDAAGQVLVGPDLSFDAPGAPTPGLDAYGHGTFMAGIIAGRDAVASPGEGASPGDLPVFRGMAPAARIVNVKVGAADGAADVSQVIAAID